MSSPLATASLLLAGFTVYAAIHSLFNAYYRPQRRMYVYFALMCIFAFAYIFIRYTNFYSYVPEDFITKQRLGFLAAQLLFLSQIGFITEYTNWRPRWLVSVIVISLLTLLIMNLFLPYGLAHSSLPILRQFTLPWGETITDTRIHDKSLWWHLQWISIVGVFLFQFAAAFHQRKTGDKQRGNALLWFGGIFFAAAMSNILINFQILIFTQIAEFGIIAMILLMILYLNREARDTRLRAESAENIWSSLVMHAPNFILLMNHDGVIRFINHDLLGKDRNLVIGTHINDYLQPDSQQVMHSCLSMVIASREAVNKQLQLSTSDPLWLDVHMAPVSVGESCEQIVMIATDISQRMQMEYELRLSEEKFRQLAENIKQLFYIRDLANNRMLYVSPAYETIWGRSLDKIYADPQDFLKSIHPDDKPRVLQLISQQNQYGKLFDAEYRIIDMQGTMHWIHARSYPIWNAAGDLDRIAGIVEDITQRKQTEHRLQERTTELKESRDFIEAVIDIVGAVIIVTDSKGAIVRFNHACEHVTGYTAEEAIGRCFWDFLLLPEERPGVKNAFYQLRAGHFPNHYENYWLHKDGSKRLLAWSNTCIIDQAGDVEYVIGTAVDISEQRRAVTALRDSADKYRTLMEYASDIILIADLDGNLIECNGSALAVLGYSRKELLKLHVSDIHPAEQLARNLTSFQHLIETGSVVTNDTALLRHDGQLIPVDINANIIEYQGRKVAVGFMRDIRARKQIEQEQQQTERRHREMLVREVHHRIKNNLQGVIGLLRNSLSDEGDISEVSERLIARAISQIATIATVHGLQAHYSDAAVRICDITHAIVDQSRTYAASDIHIEFHDNVSRPALIKEQEAIPLALVINELVTNAVKHIPVVVKNKQVIVEFNGNPIDGMELRIFNSGASLPTDFHTQKGEYAGVGLELIHALLPKHHTRFSLTDDPAAGGVLAILRIEPGILSEVTEAPTKATSDDRLKQPTTPN